MAKKIKAVVSINASATDVWNYLTNPVLMKRWMGEPEMNIEVITDWKVGKPILIKGIHHVDFENKGTVLQFDPGKIIQYTHLSSISHLSDENESYSVITFLLSALEKGTFLEIQVENFPTESIYNHLAFYWHGTANVLKHVIERECNDTSTFK